MEVKMDILTVDDEPEVSEAVALTLLTKLGFPCQAFSDPRVLFEGLKETLTLDPKARILVITDHHMAGMTGIELIQTIKTYVEREYPRAQVAFLMLSGSFQVKEQAQALDALFVKKPVASDELVSAVHMLADRLAA